MKTIIVAITGASGSIYGLRLIEELLKNGYRVHLVISTQAFGIIKIETGINWEKVAATRFREVKAKSQGSKIEKIIQRHFSSSNVRYYSEYDLSAPISSGSFKTDGMLIVPCSMKTLSGIANGYANSLIERAADVTLKEGRNLILVPRETPFNAIHLENMLKLARLGVRIIPPIPAFYHKPKDIAGIINFVVGKILDSLGIEHNLFKRWGKE
ncbi:MAG: UbiX family flavin prenyltransferase [Nitrospirae bacterium]|nr:UbiX family flavin prenyltransferase [Nitrospirota bacterium]